MRKSDKEEALERVELASGGAVAGGAAGMHGPKFGYGYLDMGPGLALIQVQPGQKTGFSFYEGKPISLKGHKLSPVPRRWMRIRRAPTVIFKPGASPDVTNAVDIEMVDLSGATPPVPLPKPTGNSRWIMLAVGGAVVAGGVALLLGRPRALFGAVVDREDHPHYPHDRDHGPWPRIDHTKAYNSHRLETQYGGRMVRHAFVMKQSKSGGQYHEQDHYMILPDGSIWRYRNPTHYHTMASGKAMMVKSDKPASLYIDNKGNTRDPITHEIVESVAAKRGG